MLVREITDEDKLKLCVGTHLGSEPITHMCECSAKEYVAIKRILKQRGEWVKFDAWQKGKVIIFTDQAQETDWKTLSADSLEQLSQRGQHQNTRR